MKRLLISLSIICGILALVGLSWYNRYSIYDDVRLYNYSPPAEVSQLANQTTMTPYAKKLFYVYHPDIEDSSQFNKSCSVTQEAIVLGCTQINKGIYLFQINDSNLNGVMQVTAAHEMLHVGYSRLSPSELSYINNLVMSTYYKLAPSDPLLKSEYQSYLKTEGASAVPNEMHSVLGTEISKLPPALENYYKQYFTNRQAIVNYANAYESAFTQRQDQVQQDDTTLTTMQQQISTDENSLQQQSQQLSQEQNQINQLRNTSQVNTYNSMVNNYNAQVNNYNNLVNQTKILISQYNTIVAQRNSEALSEDNLIKSISSLPSTISSN